MSNAMSNNAAPPTQAQIRALVAAADGCKRAIQDAMDRIATLSREADRAGNNHLANQYNEAHSSLALELMLLRRDEIERIDNSPALQQAIDGLSKLTTDMMSSMDRMRSLAAALNMVAMVAKAVGKVASMLPS